MQSLDIVKLIEKNSMTRLSKEYQHKLLNKIKDSFTDTQQQLFVSSFYCYLHYRSNDFVVDFDHIWKWLGFSRKDNAKKVLEKNFVIDTDYKVEKAAPQVGGNIIDTEKTFPQVGGNIIDDTEKTFPQVGEAAFDTECKDEKIGIIKGRPSEKITLTVNAFKKFCLKAGTKKADEIHEYYIKLEELLHETMNEESSELREQLKDKTKQNSELELTNKKLKRHIVRRYETRYKEGNCLYLVTSSEHKDTYKIGITKNINDRLRDFNTGSPYEFKTIELYYTNFNVLLEKMIKEIFSKDRISVNCEWYELKSLEKIKDFITSQIEIYNKYEDTSEDVEEKREEMKQNKKKCNECEKLLPPKQFFDGKDACIDCYEKEHGESKQCTKCRQIKNKYLFIVDVSKKDGLTYDCKDCRYEMNKKIKEENHKKHPNSGKKKCVTCNEYKYFKLFFRKGDEYVDDCKSCYNEKNSESKQCMTCSEIKIVKEFTIVRINSDGLSSYCKTCSKVKRDSERSEQRSEQKEININRNKKQCVRCNQSKDLKYFFKTNEKEYEECRDCYVPFSLQCSKCVEIKEASQFSKDSSKSTGYRTVCKNCTKSKK
jgi:hypothetical protein